MGLSAKRRKVSEPRRQGLVERLGYEPVLIKICVSCNILVGTGLAA